MSIKNLSITTKLISICVILTIPITILLYLLVAAGNESIGFSSKELKGTEYLRPTMHLMKLVDEHYEQMYLYANGQQENKREIQSLQTRIDQAFSEVELVDKRLDSELKSTMAFQNLQEEWRDIKPRALQMGVEETNTAHLTLLKHLRDLIEVVGDQSNLVLDPDLDSFYLMEVMLFRMPVLFDILPHMEVYVQTILKRSLIRPEEVTQLTVWLGELETQIIGIDKAISKSLANNQSSEFHAALTEIAKQTHQINLEFIELVRKDVLKATQLKMKSEDFHKKANTMIHHNYQLWDKVVFQLDKLLEQRIQGLKTRRNTYLGLVFLILAIAFAHCAITIRSIVLPLREAMDIANQLASGDLTVQVEVKTTEETGKLLRCMREMVGSLNRIVAKVLQSADTLQDTAQAMLAGSLQMTASSEEMKSQSEGIAAASEQIHTTLQPISASNQQATQNMSQITANIRELANHLDGLEKEMSRVSSSQSEITGLSQDASKIAKNAGSGAQQTRQKMDELQQATKRIGNVVSLINDISTQTRILALNASIEAASAGDVGKGFAVVASEVKNLAQETNLANAEIGKQVQQIQSFTLDSLKQTEEVSSIIERLSSISHTIETSIQSQNQSISKIDEAIPVIAQNGKHSAESANQAELGMKEIAMGTAEVVNGIREVNLNIQGIQTAIREVNAQVHQSRNATEELNQMAEDLKAVIKHFKLAGESTDLIVN